MSDKRERIRHQKVALSAAQRMALARLPVKPGADVELDQTKTKSGGTHLYVKSGRREWHIARNGNVIEIGVVVDGARSVAA